MKSISLKTAALYFITITVIGLLITNGVDAKTNNDRSSFEKSFMSYDVQGISMNMKNNSIEEVLTKSGYSLKRKTHKNNQVTYKYVRRINNKYSSVVIWTGAKNDKVISIQTVLTFAKGDKAISDDRERMLKTFTRFKKSCQVLKNIIQCNNFTDTHKLSIKAKYSNNSLRQTLWNKESHRAKTLAHQRAQRKLHSKRYTAKQEKVSHKHTNNPNATTKKSASISKQIKKQTPKQTQSYNGPYKKYVDAIKKRIKELDSLPLRISTMAAIQEEYDNIRLHGILLDGKRTKLSFNDKSGTNKVLYKELGHGSVHDWLKSLANKKAPQVIEFEFNRYPATVDGLLDFITYMEYEAKHSLKRTDLGYAKLNHAYRTILKKKSLATYTTGMKQKIKQVEAFKGKDYASFNDLKSINNGVVHLNKLRNLTEDWYKNKEAGDLSRKYSLTYQEVVDSLINNSTPALVAWVKSMPPSKTALIAVDKFTKETFGNAGYVPARHTLLHKAVIELKNKYNPDSYQKPEIIYSLLKGYWHEVRIKSLDEIAYSSTTFNTFNKRCPGITSASEKKAFDRTARSNIMTAMSRIRHGRFLTAEENRMSVILVLNSMINRPGCKVDNYGNITSCVTEQQSKAMNKAILTSAAAVNDIHKFLSKNNCSSKQAKKYIHDLSAQASGQTNRRSAGFAPKFPY